MIYDAFVAAPFMFALTLVWAGVIAGGLLVALLGGRITWSSTENPEHEEGSEW